MLLGAEHFIHCSSHETPDDASNDREDSGFSNKGEAGFVGTHGFYAQLLRWDAGAQ